jgi:hypothetical protein
MRPARHSIDRAGGLVDVARRLAAIALATGLTACGDAPPVPQPTPVSSCTFQIAPAAFAAPPAGGTQHVTITASPAGCSPSGWTASIGASTGVSLSATSGAGSGSVDVVVAANASTFPRSMALVVAGQSFAITQGPALIACAVTYEAVAPDAPGGRAWNLTANGGVRQVRVTVTPDASNCAEGWKSSADAFIAATPATGARSALVTLTVAANIGAARTGTIGFAGEHCSPFCSGEYHENSFTLTQAGASGR